jgi:hypothetical protein
VPNADFSSISVGTVSTAAHYLVAGFSPREHCVHKPAQERGLKPATTLLVRILTEIHEKFGLTAMTCILHRQITDNSARG